MAVELRRRRGALRKLGGEVWGLLLEALVVGLLVAAALGLAWLTLLVA
jgi:hypothetical protein